MDREGRGGPDWSDGENEVDEGIREDPDVGFDSGGGKEELWDRLPRI